MIIHEYEIPYKYGETISFKAISDIHLGNAACDVRAFKSDMKEYGDKGSYFMFMGDQLDLKVISSPHYKKSIDSSEGDDLVDEQIDKFINIVEKYKDQIIGIGSGNHEENIINRCNTNSTKRICKRLKCKNLGYSGLVTLKLREGKARIRTVVVRWHHGWGGGGRTMGNSLTKYSKDIPNWKADIFLYGHDHQNKTDRIERMRTTGKKSFIAEPIRIGVCGTYLKTYLQSINTTYSKKAGYNPTRVGGIEILIKPVEPGWVDIKMVN